MVVMWGWFITPNFSITPPSIFVATATLLMFIFAIPYRGDPDGSKPDIASTIARCAAVGFIWPLGMLGMGWLWKWLQWRLA